MNKPFQLDEEAERRLQELVEATGKPADDIIRDALEAWATATQQSDSRGTKRTPAEKGAAIDAVVARLKTLPVLDARSADEIIGYDEDRASSVIIVDASAIIAILRDKPEKGPVKTGIGKRRSGARLRRERDSKLVSTCVRATEKRGLKRLFDFLADADIEVAAFDEDQGKAAIEAYGRYGKGLVSDYPSQSWRMCRLRARQDP